MVGFIQQSVHSGASAGTRDRASGGSHDPIGEEGLSGIRIHGDSLVIAQFGGSAWKWQRRSTYLYDHERQGFYQMEERTRSYHAASLDTMADELTELKAAKAHGWRTEQAERHTALKNLKMEAQWKVTCYAPGERPMGR